MLAEQRDGQTLFGRPLEALTPEAFNDLARDLGIGLVVALDEDVGRSRFLIDNQSVRSLTRIGSFNVFVLAGGGSDPTPVGAQRWQVSPPPAAAGWVSLPIAYSPLWRAHADGAPLRLRRGERGLVEVELVTPGSSVELEHRAGAAEWAGGGLSLGAVLLLVVWRRRAPHA
jgi:hypothetical protein